MFNSAGAGHGSGGKLPLDSGFEPHLRDFFPQVLDTALEGKRFLVGDTFSIADIASFCWVICAPCVSFASPLFRVMFHMLYAGSRLPPLPVPQMSPARLSAVGYAKFQTSQKHAPLTGGPSASACARGGRAGAHQHANLKLCQTNFVISLSP